MPIGAPAVALLPPGARTPHTLGPLRNRYATPPLVATLRAAHPLTLVQTATASGAVVLASQRAAPSTAPRAAEVIMPAGRPAEMIAPAAAAPAPVVAAPSVANLPPDASFAIPREGAAARAATEGATVSVSADNWLFAAVGVVAVGAIAAVIYFESRKRK